jgi:hypothetical protein
VRRILDGLGFARRQMLKVLPGGDSPHRDAQFRHLAHLIQEFLEVGNPVLSIDTKKKEFLGTLYRDGKVYCQQALKAFDHDFPSRVSGVIIPHGLYDLARKQGIADSGYRLIINCNADGGQEVYHLHLHLLGGRPLGPMVSRAQIPGKEDKR